MVIGARTKAALRVKKNRGQRVGAVPIGYRLCDDGMHAAHSSLCLEGQSPRGGMQAAHSSQGRLPTPEAQSPRGNAVQSIATGTDLQGVSGDWMAGPAR